MCDVHFAENLFQTRFRREICMSKMFADEEGGDWYICMRSPDVGCIWNRTSGSAGADSV